MTEVPEHLLRRSRERRAALGLGGGDATAGGGDAPVPAKLGAAAVEPAGGPAAAPVPAAAASSPAVPTEVESPAAPYIAYQSATKGRVPMWVMPVLLLLPFWAILYMGAFGERSSTEELDPAALGAEVYRSAGCSACHGGAGEGGVGPALTGGESAITFPDEADHIEWIRTGSGAFTGQPYGDPDREGGQRGPATGSMPGFANLSDEEVAAVVLYEREEL